MMRHAKFTRFTMQQSIGYAGFPRRLAAACYDGFLLFAVLFAAAALYGWLQDQINPSSVQQFSTGDVTHELEPIAEGWLYNLYLLCVITLFYTLFWCKNGQTLGMQAWRIRLQSDEGNIVSIPTAICRVICALLCGGPIGMLSALVRKDAKALFDIVCKTEVVLLEKKK